MNTHFSTLLAEVVDKEATLVTIWLVAFVFSIASLALCRGRRWTAVIVLVAAGAWAVALLSELRDPSVGPALLQELGRAFVIQSYIAAFLPFFFMVIGFVPWSRRNVNADLERVTSDPATVEIDLSAVESMEQLHALFQERFHFPDYYGCNWAAFWDSITGLVELPPRIRLRGWQQFESRFPRDARIMRECLMDYRTDLGERASEIEYV